ncbi:MAG: pyrroline-5-carboxylate reductase [Clostridia bacterium]|nr:pyrroline-5-carboxylate reductase [Clostridia bacterium]
MTIGFIGCGKMGEAILKGIACGGDHPEIIVSRRNRAELERIRNTYRVGTGTNADAAKCGTVFLAVKPQQYDGVIKEIRDAVHNDALLIYLAPGISPEQMEAKLEKPGLKIIHLMPNTPCAVAAGVNAYACGKTVGRTDEEMFAALVSPCGTPVRVEEGQMNAVVGISGSSPAYYYMMIDAVAKAGVRAGLKRDDAVRMAAQAMLGSAKMVLESGKHPSQLRDDVCSPGGTTIEAVCSLDMAGFEGIVMDSIQKCIDRSREISRQIT